MAKVRSDPGHLKATESAARGRVNDLESHPNPQPLGRSVAKGYPSSERRLSHVCSRSRSQPQTVDADNSRTGSEVDQSGEATPFWDRGIFSVRLNRDPSGYQVQDIAVGIDPGSKKEGLTVKSASHTYLNIQADAVTHVKEAKADQSASRRRGDNDRHHVVGRGPIAQGEAFLHPRKPGGSGSSVC